MMTGHIQSLTPNHSLPQGIGVDTGYVRVESWIHLALINCGHTRRPFRKHAEGEGGRERECEGR